MQTTMKDFKDLEQIKIPHQRNGKARYTNLFKKQCNYLFRKEGKKIREISKENQVPVSTLHGWLFPKRKRRVPKATSSVEQLARKEKSTWLLEIVRKEDKAKVILFLIENEIKFNSK